MYEAKSHFQKLYGSIEGEFSFRATKQKEWFAWQRAFRPRLREALGLNVMERDLEGHTPTAERESREDLGDFVSERLRLWTEPTVALPFHLLRPKNQKGPLPLVLTPHGHHHPHLYVGIAKTEEEQRSIREGERDVACQAVREGYLTIAPTTRGFGETRTEEDRRQNNRSSCRTELMHGLLVGRTPIGERVWDMARLIDWALNNESVDHSRIAITGNSGGGTVSLFAAACDERIHVVVPSCYFCTFRASIGTIHHCDCNYIPGMLRLGEMYDVAGLVAPRAFCAIAGKEDPIFPFEGVRFAFERLKRIYEVAQASDRCELYVGNGGHRYYKAGAWPFVRKHFGY